MCEAGQRSFNSSAACLASIPELLVEPFVAVIVVILGLRIFVLVFFFILWEVSRIDIITIFEPSRRPASIVLPDFVRQVLARAWVADVVFVIVVRHCEFCCLGSYYCEDA
jgi:hypothetical protein